MSSQARKRTVAQRKQKEEDGMEDDVRIQDEQEQEDEISRLRQTNEANKRRAQFTMDIGVLVALAINGMSVLRTASRGLSFALVVITLQTALLPLSLTPRWMQSYADRLEQSHVYVAGGQLVLLLVALWLLSSSSSWRLYDVAQVALPLVVAGGVEVQRRGDRELERQMQSWERSRYDVKGA